LLSDLPADSSEEGLVNVVIETPRGNANKFDYDPTLGAMRLKKVLPQGMVFPFDFGFIPSTLADDGDPEDVLVLIEHSVAPGVVLSARLIGVIEAIQTEPDKDPQKNDRLIAVVPACRMYASMHTLADLPKEVVDQIEHFFVTYNAEEGKQFEPQGQHGPTQAMKCLHQAQKRYARTRQKKE